MRHVYRHALRMMIVAALISSTAPASQAQQTELLRNGNFEVQDLASPTVPAAWVNDKAEAGFRLSEDERREGQRSLEIRFDETKSTAGYAGAIQRANMRDLAGRTFKLRAWLKRNNPASSAGLWLAFEDAGLGDRLGV